MTMIPTEAIEIIARAIKAEMGKQFDAVPVHGGGPEDWTATGRSLDLLEVSRAALLAAQDLGWVMRRESDFSSGWPSTTAINLICKGCGGIINTPGGGYTAVFHDGKWYHSTSCVKADPDTTQRALTPPVTPEKETKSLNPHSKQD